MNIKKETNPLNVFYYIIPFLGALITALIYAPTVHFGFLFDDVPNIMRFYDIRHATLKDLFFSRTRWFSHWLNTFHYAFGKYDPFSYRLFNICMHSLAGILVFFIILLALRRTASTSFFYVHRRAIALLTSLLFLLHPVQTQTISYVIQGQLEGMAGFFTLSMVLVFLLMASSKHKITYMPLCALLFTLGLFSVGTKEIAIISPLILILVDWFFVARGRVNNFKHRILLHLSMMALVWGGYVYLLKPEYFTKVFGFTMKAPNNFGNLLSENHGDRITPYQFFISQFKVILHYIWIFIWPFNISIDYDEKLARGFFAPDCLAPFLVLLSIGFLCLYLLYKKKTNLVSFAIMWFFIVILPRSSIIPATELIADYKTYLASVGLLFLGAAALVKIINMITQNIWVHALFGLSLLSFLGWATTQRNQVWSSAEALWSNAIQNAPSRARVYNNYANALLRAKKYDEAIPYYLKALELEEQYPDAWCNLGLVYKELDRLEEAFKCIAKAVRLNPSPENYMNLGIVCSKLGKFQDAIDACLGAIQKYRYMHGCHYGKAWLNLGSFYARLGQDEKSWEAYRMACTQADMDNEMGFLAFGRKSLQLEKYDDAIFAYSKAYEENPANETLFWLAYTHLQAQHAEIAEQLFNKLYHLIPRDPRVTKGLQQARKMRLAK